MIVGGLSFDGIIFDLDGTLIDSGGIWQSVDEKFFSERKLKMPPDYPSAIAHLGFEKAAVYTKKRFHLEEAPEEIVREWENEVVDLYRNELLLKDGAEDFLRLAEKSGCALGIATAAQKNCYERRHDALSLRKAFAGDLSGYRGKMGTLSFARSGDRRYSDGASKRAFGRISHLRDL